MTSANRGRGSDEFETFLDIIGRVGMGSLRI